MALVTVTPKMVWDLFITTVEWIWAVVKFFWPYIVIIIAIELVVLATQKFKRTKRKQHIDLSKV